MAASADPTGTALPRTQPGVSEAFRVKNAVTIYNRSIASLLGPAAASANGYVVPFAGAAGEIPLGPKSGGKTLGNTSGTPIPETAIGFQPDAEILTVAGVANTIADVGCLVHATDDNTYTIAARAARTTPGCSGIAIGMIVRHSTTSGKALVQRFSAEGLLLLQLLNQRRLWNLGSFDCDTITAANLRTGLLMPCAGNFVAVFAMVDVAITGSSGTALLNLEIDGTDVTGGVVTVSTAAGGTKGTRLDGTDITAANRFREGSLLDIEAATVTDMTAGRFDLYAVVDGILGV